MKSDFHKLFEEMHRTTIGLESLFDEKRQRVSIKTNFPPYNIRRIDDTHYQIELAVAGFSKDDIDIKLEKSVITVVSNGHDTGSDSGDFIHQGFTYRGFERSFTLMDNVEVTSADLNNGILVIYLEKMIPEDEKPRKIQIGSSTQQLLTE